MRRRSRAGGEVKKRRSKAATPKRSNAPKAVRYRSSSATSHEAEVVRLTRERDEALEQLSAASKILKVISSLPGDLKSVFEAILENATRICEAKFGILYRFDGEAFHFAAGVGTPTGLAEFLRGRGPFRPTLGGRLDNVMRTKQVSHTADITAEAVTGPAARLADARSTVCVPMLKDDVLVGAIFIYRQEVRPFTEKQIELVQDFAAQGVIAIENTRLLNELRQSLEQQTATSEVLSVISSSPGELKLVFDTILENATRICEAEFGILCSYDGNLFKYAAVRNVPPALLDFVLQRGSFLPKPRTPLDQLLKTGNVVHRADTSVDEVPSDSARLGGAKSHLAVPMFKDEALVGAIIIYRQEVRPFGEKQIALVQNFAAQAVIAIENARLLDELKQSLEQQTATADVLRVISSSPSELEPVFQSMLINAIRICEAEFGHLLLYDGECFRAAYLHNLPPAYRKFWEQGPRRVSTKLALGRLPQTKEAVQITDMKADRAYGEGDPLRVATVDLGGAQTLLCVPMLKEDQLIGAIVIYRQEARPFTDKQVELVKNFAAQAVIAIENARLLKELRERTVQVVKLNEQLEQRVADQVGEIERMGRLRRFLPRQVADLIVASGTEKQLESHRREITALFCDLRGFTGFSESSDPEDVMALLAEYHAAIGKIIIKYSGTLERYAGDGVMVIFNDPVPVENPALQAVLMALDMRAAIGALIEKWRDLGHDLGFGIGIAHGFATLGTIGFEGRRDYAAIGTVSNVASRLCDEAKPGQILISPRVRQAVEKGITVEPVGEFALKGIRRPMTAYNVLEASLSKPS
jgi:class 3 adenylate cyclase/putative methionine-R-sulfoxide reductase with GAF domain